MEEIALFTPGPTHIPKRVLSAMSVAEVHHRTAEFRRIFGEAGEQLQELLSTETRPLFLACSGTGGLEAVVANSLTKNDTLGYLDAGKFGARWGAIAKAKSISAIPLSLEWGETPTIEVVREYLKKNSEITHFGVQYCETSTTVLHDVPAISKLLREEFPEIFFFIDAISAATTLPISLTELHWDAVVLASQKAFMLPPGLSMLFLSERYWGKAESVQCGSLYFDLKHEKGTQAKNNGAWTPAASLIIGLKEALSLFKEEGFDSVYARHLACKECALEWFTKLGIQPVHPTHGSTSVTGGFPTDGVDVEAIRSKLFETAGIRVAGGQDHWKGKVLRFGHMGVITPEDMTRCFQALEKVL